MTATEVELGQPEIPAKPEPEDLKLWSVTTIIGVLDKPALLYWAAEQTAAAAIHSQATWQAMLDEQGEDEAIRWLRDARFRRPKGELSAASLGTACHRACEEYALSGVRPDRDRLAAIVQGEGGPKFDAVADEVATLEQMLDCFDDWLQQFTPSYEATEVAVYHPDYGYAGTTDGFLTIDGVRLIIDYKTSRRSLNNQGKATGPYPEAALQLAAYRYAKLAAVWRPRIHEHYRRRYYLLGPTEQAQAQPVPEVDGGLVIHITPQHCHGVPVRCDERVFEAFLYVQEAARWQFELSNQVIGIPMTPPNGGAA